jgi:hypothetical protein
MDEIMEAVKKLIENSDYAKSAKELEEGGVGNTSLENLTLLDLSVKLLPETLGEYLPVFGRPEDILKFEKIAKEKPEIYDAKRSDESGSNIYTTSSK